MQSQQNVQRATMDARAAAAYIGLSYWKTLELVKAGELPHIRIGSGTSGRVLFRRESLDNWLTRCEANSINTPGTATGKIRQLK